MDFSTRDSTVVRSRLLPAVTMMALLCVFARVSASPNCPGIEELQHYTVFIEAEFPDDQRQYATGVLFSNDGLVLTDAQIIRSPSANQQQALPERYWVSRVQELKDGTVIDRPERFEASLIDSRTGKVSLALLKIERGGFDQMGLKEPPRATSQSLRSDLLCALGYAPKGNPSLIAEDGKILGQGSHHSRLRTEFEFRDAQIGSPVFNAQGQVVGIASSETDDPGGKRNEVATLGYVYSVWPGYAVAELQERTSKFEVKAREIEDQASRLDNLAQQLRERIEIVLSSLTGSDAADPVQLQRAEESLRVLATSVDHLRSYGEWVAPHRTADCRLRVSYKMLFKGDYPVKCVNMRIFISYTDNNDKPQILPPLEEQIVGQRDELKRLSFCPSESLRTVKTFAKLQKWKSIDRLEIKLVPYSDRECRIEMPNAEVVEFAPIDDPQNALNFQRVR